MLFDAATLTGLTEGRVQLHLSALDGRPAEAGSRFTTAAGVVEVTAITRVTPRTT